MLYLGKNAVVPAITVSGGEVTSVITATNNTGSAISEGDKVWINQEDGNTYELVNYYSSVPNFNTVGSPTITNGVASGFSNDDYLQLPQAFNPGNNPWEIKVKFSTDNSSTDRGILQCSSDSSTRWGVVLLLSSNWTLWFAVSTDGANWNFSADTTQTLQPNSTYYVKIGWTGTEYYLNLSSDNETYEQCISIESTSHIYESLGHTRLGSYYIYPYTSSIDLKETYIKIDGADWWTPYATNITSATQTGTAVENISSGGTGLVNVGAVIKPTGSITITENGTHDVTNYAEAVVNVPVPVVDKYKVGDRVNDDSNNPVGTVSGIKTDGNGQRYAVICLDGSYRGNGQYHSTRSEITGLPSYANRSVWSNKETATNNTQKILDYASSQGTSSSACNLCRAASFIINDVTYHGQFPTVDELVDIFKNMDIINSQDTSGINAIPVNGDVWSSTQCGSSVSWMSIGDGAITNYYMDSSFFVIPVLEIPLDD